MNQNEKDTLRSQHDVAPQALDLHAILGVIPTWRLFDVATCFGLWRTEGMSRHELVAALSQHTLVSRSSLWSVMTRKEKDAALKQLPPVFIEAKSGTKVAPSIPQPRGYQFPRGVLEVLDNTLFGGRLRRLHPEPVASHKQDSTSWRSFSTPLLSILMLLDFGRVAELSASFGMSETQPLDVAVALERKRVRSKDLLHKLTGDELRLIAAAWTLTAGRDDLLKGLEAAMNAPAPEPVPARAI